MNVLLLMVDVKCIVLIHLGHFFALVMTMKYLMLQDYSVFVSKALVNSQLKIIYLINFSAHNECATGAHNCEQVCYNLVPYWSCGCYAGYSLRSDGRTCQGKYKIYINTVSNNNSFC